MLSHTTNSTHRPARFSVTERMLTTRIPKTNFRLLSGCVKANEPKNSSGSYISRKWWIQETFEDFNLNISVASNIRTFQTLVSTKIIFRKMGFLLYFYGFVYITHINISCLIYYIHQPTHATFISAYGKVKIGNLFSFCFLSLVLRWCCHRKWVSARNWHCFLKVQIIPFSHIEIDLKKKDPTKIGITLRNFLRIIEIHPSGLHAFGCLFDRKMTHRFFPNAVCLALARFNKHLNFWNSISFS